MESQLVSDLRAELAASRRENKHICTQVQVLCMEFGLYRKATQVKLSELRQHKRMLEGKAMGLQKRLWRRRRREQKKVAAARVETKDGRHPSMSDDDAVTRLIKGIEDQNHAQDPQALEMSVQWGSPLLDREIAAAVDGYASEVAASVNVYDGGSMTPSAAVSALMDSSHPHDQAGDSQQRLPDNGNNDADEGSPLGPFYPAPLPVALGGHDGEEQGSGGHGGEGQGSRKGSRPRRKTESGKFSSKDAKALRKRALLLRRVTHSGAPYSDGSLH